MKDYVSVAGNLGITHMVFLSQTLLHTTLRMGHFPRGPSLYFDVLKYSLMKDVHHSSEKPATLGGIEYKHAPLVLLDGFDANQEESGLPLGKNMGDKEKRLLSVFIQNMFPPIHVPTMRVNDAKRVLLFHLESPSDVIHVRHYLVKTTHENSTSSETIDLLKTRLAMKKQKKENNTIESVAEETNQEHQPSQKSVVVSEIGPRLSLQLTKVADGFMESDPKKIKILYSRYTQLRDEELDDSEQKGKSSDQSDCERELENEIFKEEQNSSIKKKKISFEEKPSKKKSSKPNSTIKKNHASRST